jgi:hypothetical protein
MTAILTRNVKCARTYTGALILTVPNVMGAIFFVRPVFILVENLTDGTRGDIKIIDAFNDVKHCNQFHLSPAL